MNLVAAAVITLASCGDTSDGAAIIKQILTGLTAKEQPVPAAMDIETLKSGLTPEVLAQIGGPVLIVQVPSRDALAVMVKVGSNDGVDTFLTPDGISISVRDGMIVATRGLGFDLMTADISEPLAALRNQMPRARRVHRYLDGENQLIVHSYICTYSASQDLQISEACKSPSEFFENSYTIDNKGAIISSRQWISPQIGSVTTELIE